MESLNHAAKISLLKERLYAIAFIAYPLLAGFAFAVHPDLLSLALSHDASIKIAEFRGNTVLHFGHFLMALSVPLLIAIALRLGKEIEAKMPLTALVGTVIAIAGAIILAMDKAALCLVPSALESLNDTDFTAMKPGIEAIFGMRGFLTVLRFLPLLPLGFIILSAGLVKTGERSKWISIPMLAGSILMANPDIDIIGLVATAILALGFVPYAVSLWRAK